MEIGSYIKLHRIKQEMTQAELAEGIVSFAYLSKIENGKTEASPEVISLLCTRLGIQLDNEKDITIKNKCQEWYSQLFEVNDKDEIERGYNELEALMEDTHSESMVMFEIHKIRYFLILGRYEAALTQINSLADLSSTFDSLHQFYWYKFKGNYNSQVGEFNQAMRMYKLAEEKLNHLELAESEIADLQYTISVTHSKLRNTLDSIEYANKALDVFQRNYNFLRCAQCHIMLGISYRRLKMYDKAIKNHNLAKHLGKLNKNKQIIQLVNQNLGVLYSTKGQQEEAIKFFRAIIDDDEVHIVERFAAVASIVNEYYNVQNFEKAKELVNQGFELMKQFGNMDPYKLYYYVMYTYYFALNGEHEKFENIVINEFIPYLKKHKDYINLVIYARMLAEHYENSHQYKNATKYYKLANSAYEQLTIL
ncbi:transcriptional regulator [Lentibacillus populi]|uniref:Transcriptional regulator n=1 Tax=Lentibacillus populi TaxID=1827502 RepID=A0A9W5TZ56_9BACI|nr:helix-turn-helix domain-containing protein [Lentibacillus populi]MBT2217473.1 helix-turn-helix domain-containing protein [Virgibacillus dakarensis]GGB49918.1 transcriptional regulator [Lentibacillus populi]